MALRGKKSKEKMKNPKSLNLRNIDGVTAKKVFHEKSLGDLVQVRDMTASKHHLVLNGTDNPLMNIESSIRELMENNNRLLGLLDQQKESQLYDVKIWINIVIELVIELVHLLRVHVGNENDLMRESLDSSQQDVTSGRDSLISGMNLVIKRIHQKLAQLGVFPIPTKVGDVFNPEIHQITGIGQSFVDVDHSIVTEILEQGYMWRQYLFTWETFPEDPILGRETLESLGRVLNVGWLLHPTLQIDKMAGGTIIMLSQEKKRLTFIQDSSNSVVEVRYGNVVIRYLPIRKVVISTENHHQKNVHTEVYLNYEVFHPTKVKVAPKVE